MDTLYFDQSGDPFDRFMNDSDVHCRCEQIFSELPLRIFLAGKEVPEAGCGPVCLTRPNRIWYPALRLSTAMGLRKFRGIGNRLFPRPALQIIDPSFWHSLHGFMIHYGIRVTKESHD